MHGSPMHSAATEAKPSPSSAPTPGRSSVPWKAVALPVEHGGWGLLGEPVALGLLLAPSAAGLCLALSALAGFLSRHPLRLVFMDRRKHARYPRTGLAERFFAGYALAALALLGAASVLARTAFWPALLAAAPFALAALLGDALGRSRQALPEAAGAMGLTAAAALIALAGGARPGVALAAWALLALRALTSVLYVRARIRLDRRLPAGPSRALAGHHAALAATAALARSGFAPWLAVAAFVVLLARAAWGLSPWRRPVRPQRLGFEELGYGLLTVLLVATGYLARA